MKKTITLFALLCAFTATKAQVYWNFTTPTPTTNAEVSVSVDTFTNGNNNGVTPVRTTTSASNGYTGASGGHNIGAAAFTGGFNPATSTYFELVLTPTIGYSVLLTGISFGSRSTSTGPQAYAVTSSVDGFTSTLAAGALSNNSTWTTTGQQALNVVGLAGVPVILRIYGFNGTGTPSLNTANWRVDDLTLYTTPLPIKLISFDATVNAGTVRLKWLTGEETDGGKIVIEKAGDSRNFTEIGEVAAKNGLENSYSFEDALSTGNSYYRLKLVDKNGSFAYSNTVAVKGKATTSISLFPNPAASTLRINMGKKATYSSYRIVGIDGRVAMTADFPEGNSEIVVDLAGLTKGRYLISLEGNSGQESHSFIKE